MVILSSGLTGQTPPTPAIQPDGGGCSTSPDFGYVFLFTLLLGGAIFVAVIFFKTKSQMTPSGFWLLRRKGLAEGITLSVL